MLSNELITKPYISTNELFFNSTNDFLKSFKNAVNPDIRNDMHLNFEIYHKSDNKKISPILTLAKPEDARIITKIYKELYHGMYPYKEMENEREVRKMIESSNYQWVLFKDNLNNIIGCITFVLDFKNKKGYIRGLMLRKKYQGNVDVVKAMIGAMIGMCSTFKDEIFLWYCENRTAHAKSQYAVKVCGLSPIAFFPNKDMFFNKNESDLMQIIYDKRALTIFRRRDFPKILHESSNCFIYSNIRYNLGPVELTNPHIELDPVNLVKIKKRIIKNITKDKMGYTTINFSINNSRSYFKFLYTPTVQNFEKTKYKVKNLEELFVFVQEFKKCARELNVRYIEAFISAYEPNHQKIFLDAGLSPRGYIPSWKYNKKKRVFEDCILFNYFEGKIDKNIQLIPEGKILLKFLKSNLSYLIEK